MNRKNLRLTTRQYSICIVFLLWFGCGFGISIRVCAEESALISEAAAAEIQERPFYQKYQHELTALGIVLAGLLASGGLFFASRRQAKTVAAIFSQLPGRTVIADRNGHVLFCNDGGQNPKKSILFSNIRQIPGATPEILHMIDTVFKTRRGATLEGSDGLGIRTAVFAPLPTKLFGTPAVVWLSHRNSKLQQSRDLLIQRLRSYVNNERIVNECLSQIALGTDFEAHIDGIIQAIVRQLDCDRVCFCRYHGGDSAHGWDLVRNWTREGVETLSAADQEQCQKWFSDWRKDSQQHETTLISSAETPRQRDLLNAAHCRSLEVAPIFVKNELFGVLGVGFVRHPRKFSSLDNDVMRSAANIVALARERTLQHQAIVNANAEKLLIFNHIDIPIWLYDSHAKLLQVNPTVERLAGMSSAAILQCNCNDIFCKDTDDRPLCPVVKAIAIHARASRLATVLGREVLITAVPVYDSNGEIIYVIKTAVDLTDINESNRKLEKAMVAAQAADRAKSYFLATMSHELRTPLNAVIGFSELLQTGTLSPEEQSEYFKAIHFSGTALLQLINDILDLTKLEAQQMNIVLAFDRLDKLGKEIQSIFSLRLREKNLAFKLEVSPDLPWLKYDHHRMRQVLLNLVGNAVKFTDAGTITLAIGFTRISDRQGKLVLLVRDTGCGIKAELQPHIFEPFVQQDTARGSKMTEGTGLGLAISLRMIERMGGTLTLASQPGSGSTFTIELPTVEYSAEFEPHNAETASR